MQCFTLPSLYPKTSTSYDYRAPLKHQLYRRPHYIPEPDKNGRMWAPDAFKPPLPFKQPRNRPVENQVVSVLEALSAVGTRRSLPQVPLAKPLLTPTENNPWMIYEPVNHKHRNKKMAAMLDHINKVNWTTGRDSEVKPHRDTTVIRKTVNFRHSERMPTVTHTTYVDPGPPQVDRKWQSNIPAIGIRPCTYVVPYTKERCITANRTVGCLPTFPDIPPRRTINEFEPTAGQFRFAVEEDDDE